MLEARKSAVQALRNQTRTNELETILDFFEVLGVLVRKHAVDEYLVWNSFSYWILRYADLASDQIVERRNAESDPTDYEEFDRLVKCMKQIEIRERKLKVLPSFSREQLDTFVSEEIDD
jgi:hypothetical protein